MVAPPHELRLPAARASNLSFRVVRDARRLVRCWGTGPLGDGALQSDGVVDVSGLTDVQAVVGGWSHTCALVTGGEVFCWGGGDGFSHVGGSDGGAWLTPTRVEL